MVGANGLKGDGGRVLSTGAAVLDEGDNGHLGRLHRSPSREPGVLAVEVPNLLGLGAADKVVGNLGRARLSATSMSVSLGLLRSVLWTCRPLR